MDNIASRDVTHTAERLPRPERRVTYRKARRVHRRKMSRCDRCETPIDTDDRWVTLRHHHPHMEFGSRFCSTDCAVAYLEDDLSTARPADD
jgi:hypothetical protein